MMVYCSPALACISRWCGRYFGRYFNICDPEEGRLDVWNHTFTDGDPGKTAVFHSFFPYVLEIAQSNYTRDSSAVGNICTLSRIVFFKNLPMAEARDFHCSSHVVEILGKKTLPSDHAAVRLVIQKATVDDTRTNVFPVVPSSSSFVTTTDSLLTHFVHWLNFKFSNTKQRRVRNVSCQNTHLTASAQSF